MSCSNCGRPVRITRGLGTGELIIVHADTFLCGCYPGSLKTYAESDEAEAAIERAENAAEAIIDEANALTKD